MAKKSLAAAHNRADWLTKRQRARFGLAAVFAYMAGKDGAAFTRA